MKRYGFSLIELSIVLVILGLLTGGVLTGRSLIHAAELRSVNKQREQIVVAAKTFQGKYLGLPGDLINATRFWGDASPSCLPVNFDASPTCNGNGDGQVISANPVSTLLSDFSIGFPISDESLYFWHHLSFAGLFAHTNQTIKLDETKYWAVESVGSAFIGANSVFSGTYKNVLSMPAALVPEDLWNIDQKVDDGLPGTGRLVAYVPPAALMTDNLSQCTTATTAPYGNQTSATYRLSAQDKVCGLVYKSNF